MEEAETEARKGETDATATAAAAGGVGGECDCAPLLIGGADSGCAVSVSDAGEEGTCDRC